MSCIQSIVMQKAFRLQEPLKRIRRYSSRKPPPLSRIYRWIFDLDKVEGIKAGFTQRHTEASQ